MRKEFLISLNVLLGLNLWMEDAQAASLVSAKKGEVTINANKVDEERRALWDKIGEFCAISSWHPALSNCQEIREGNSVVRILTFKDGNSSEEKLTEKGGSGYKYEIVKTTFPVQNFQGMFSISPDDEDFDELNIQWSATYDAKDKDNNEVRKKVDRLFAEGIQNLIKLYGAADQTPDEE